VLGEDVHVFGAASEAGENRREQRDAPGATGQERLSGYAGKPFFSGSRKRAV